MTCGTFLNGLIHIGEEKIKAGRLDEKRSEGITESLLSFGFSAGRLKTGTPPRIKKSSVDWSVGLAGYGDKKPKYSNTLDLATSELNNRIEFNFLE